MGMALLRHKSDPANHLGLRNERYPDAEHVPFQVWLNPDASSSKRGGFPLHPSGMDDWWKFHTSTMGSGINLL